jgi:excisionase family DNA binding protein
MATDTEKHELLTPVEVADELRLSVESVYRLSREGRLQALRVGGQNGSLRFRRGALEKLLQLTRDEGEG